MTIDSRRTPHPKEIAFVINSSFPNYSGGRETWLYNVARRLDELGVRVSIVALGDRQSKRHFSDMPGSIRIAQCSSLRTAPLLNRLLRSYIQVPNMVIESFAMSRQLRKWFGGSSRGVVYVAMDTVFTPLALRWFGVRRRHSPYAVSVRGPHAAVLSAQFPACSFLFRHLERYALVTAPTVWANGYDTSAWLQEKGVSSILVPNGVDMDRARRSDPTPADGVFHTQNFRIITVATLLDIKGIRELIEAGSLLKRAGDAAFDLIFVGKGSPRRYQDYAERLGIGDRTFFLGERRDVMPYIKASHMAACLSGGSGMSMSALECLAAGIPVTAWDTPVYRQLVVDGHTGTLVPHGDAAKLAETIHAVRNDYSRHLEMGRLASISVEQYDWSAIAGRVATLAMELSREGACAW